MDFEIEEEPSDFQFQSKWSKPSKSGGFLKGGFGSSKAAPEEDIYNYDFGGGGLGGDYEISHYSTPPSTDKFKKNEKSNSSSTEGGKISSAPAPAVSSQMSAMEKAQSMLNKYSKKATNAPANKKPTSFSNHNYLSTDYNEDDISIGSDELSTSGVMESPPPKATKGPQAKDTIKNNQPKEPIKQQLSRGFDLENDDDEDDELSESGEMEHDRLNSMPSVYDLGMQPPSTKTIPPTKSIDDDDYSKDRFDEGSVSFDDYGKGGIYQEESVLSDSAVIAEGNDKRSTGNRSDEEDVDDDTPSSKPRVFQFSEIGDILAPDAELEEDNQPAAYSVPEVEESHEESVEESNVYGNSFESEVDPYTPKKDVKTAAVKTYSQPPKKEEERPPPVKFEPVVVPATSLKKASEIAQPTQHSNPQPADPKVVENQKSRPKNSDSEASTVRSVIPPQEFPKPQANSGKDFATSAMPNPPPVQPLHHQEKLTVDPTLNSQPSFPLQPPPHQSPYPQSAGNPSNPFTYPQQSFPPYPPHPQYPQPQSSQHYQQQMPPVSPQIPTPGYPFHPQYPSYPQFPQSPHIPPPVPSQWPSQAMYPPYSFPPPPYQYYPPQPPLSYPANPFLPNPYQSLLSNPLQASQFSAQQSLAQLLQRSGLVPPTPPETSEPTMAEILRELQAAKEEAAFATKKLADVILEVHRSKTNLPPRSPPSKAKKSPGRQQRPAIQDPVEEEEEEEEEEYYEDEFEEESNLNVSTSPQPKIKTPKNVPKRNKSQTTMKAAEQEDPVCGSESTNHPLHPPVLTERDSMELNWSKPPNNQEIRRYPQESASLMRDSYDFVPAYPARETFDTLLSTSQSLYRRQLNSLREKLDSMNQSAGMHVPLTSRNDPHQMTSRSQSSLLRTYQRGSRYPPSMSTVRSSMEPIPDTRSKLREALLQVDPTLSDDDLKILMSKYS